ncbi:MAG: S9 family peptidase [Acidobacteria bacterium]|nr:S9 family peptidase [Acidobacteriota bacterium]
MNCRQTSPEPPLARRVGHTTSIFGRELVDDYHWLRNREAPEVLAYLEAENAYTEVVMAPTEGLQEALYEEMLGRILEDDSSPPARNGEYYYYTRTEEGQAYPIYCRKHGDLQAGEEILLDVNALAEGHEFFHLGDLAVSPDHRLVAYSFDTAGTENFELVVKDLASGMLLADLLEGVYYSLAWAVDSRTLFYTTTDAAHRPYRVHRHRLGDEPSHDEVVLEEADERFFATVGLTRSREYLVISLASNTTSEAHFLRADQPDGNFRVFARRRQGVEYDIDHRGNRFFVRTNLEAKNFRLMESALDETGMESWHELVAHRAHVTIESIEVFRDRIVVLERENGLGRFLVRPFDGSGEQTIELPEPVYAVAPGSNLEFDTPYYRFVYSSLITPWTTFDYEVATRRLEIRKRQEVLGGYDPELYETRRLAATAPDGVEVPLSIVYRRGLELDGSSPCLLYGYGAYGATIEPAFSSLNLTLLERGFVYAIAHVRGGGMLGELWHDAGKMLDKRNTFTDFIAVAERLIADGYTSSRRLAIRGGSAGGLLVGAAVNLRPDLFRVVLAHVPFVDVVNTMLDDSIPLTVIEYEEWGDPREVEDFEHLLSYSPYDNVTAADYPHMLVTAGLSDPRVQYWEPAKWVARLRALKTGHSVLLLKTNMGAGHSGPSGRYDYLRERAFEYAFLFEQLPSPLRDKTGPS